MSSDMLTNIAILVFLVLLGAYVMRLNRKIDLLRKALLDVGPSLEAYDSAITSHRESMSNFSDRIGKAETPHEGGEDLPGIFYAKFGNGAK